MCMIRRKKRKPFPGERLSFGNYLRDNYLAVSAAAVVSTAAAAVVSTAAAVVSTAAAVVSAAGVASPPPLQATKVAAMKAIAKNFFIWFSFCVL